MKNKTSAKSRIDAILLASGFSRRFGHSNKLLQPFCGKPLAQHTLELACSITDFNKVFFVYAQEETAFLAKSFPVVLLKNNAPERGQRESIRLGVEASDADYFLFMQCDQPLLDKKTVQYLLDMHKPGCIIQPTYRGTAGSPSLFSAAFKQALSNLKPGENARIIKNSNPSCLLSYEVENPLVLQDIDTPEELLQLQKSCC